MTYYSERRTVNNGQNPVTVTKYGTRRAMERQFHLFCANACDGDDFVNDLDAIEWGTIENGALERTVYAKSTIDSEVDTNPNEPVID